LIDVKEPIVEMVGGIPISTIKYDPSKLIKTKSKKTTPDELMEYSPIGLKRTAKKELSINLNSIYNKFGAKGGPYRKDLNEIMTIFFETGNFQSENFRQVLLDNNIENANEIADEVKNIVTI